MTWASALLRKNALQTQTCCILQELLITRGIYILKGLPLLIAFEKQLVLAIVYTILELLTARNTLE